MTTNQKPNTPEPTTFTAHHLRFEVEALTPLLLPAFAGSSIRGALFNALRHHFCPASDVEVPSAEHKAVCPACWLMATEKPGNGRGRDVPRPYTVEPPGATGETAQWFDAGERFTFGLTVFAQAMNLFPYLVMATPLMGQAGLGIPLQENGSRCQEKRRGQFTLRRIEAVNPVTGELAPVMGEGQTRVQIPDVPATSEDVWSTARAMTQSMKSCHRVRIRFRTPMRIVEGGRLVQQPWLGPIFRRLLERLDALRSEFADDPPVRERERLTSMADKVRLVQNQTRWTEVMSRSQRLKRKTPTSGLTGTALYEAEAAVWAALLPYLLWGQVIHVGKSATKGNGWYSLETNSI